jgi:hypothetical protein
MRWHKPHSLLGVEAGNRVADEQADRFNNCLGGQICRSVSLRNRPTACAC